ncbi:hypothetical protein TRVL_02353 [Trypanosoma vivax]|nr:hypothetical protein TRVL_02353 [Trypanosoma vivax]
MNWTHVFELALSQFAYSLFFVAGNASADASASNLRCHLFFQTASSRGLFFLSILSVLRSHFGPQQFLELCTQPLIFPVPPACSPKLGRPFPLSSSCFCDPPRLGLASVLARRNDCPTADSVLKGYVFSPAQSWRSGRETCSVLRVWSRPVSRPAESEGDFSS